MRTPTRPKNNKTITKAAVQQKQQGGDRAATRRRNEAWAKRKQTLRLADTTQQRPNTGDAPRDSARPSSPQVCD